MTELLPYLGAFGGLGALGLAIAVLLKVGVDKADIKIGSADKVMIGQDRFINELQESLNAQTARVDRISKEVDGLRRELLEVTHERDRLRQENLELIRRVNHLEQKVEELQNGTRRTP